MRSLVLTRDSLQELFNGRLAMVGVTCAGVGELITGKGPLEQVNLETGVPVLQEEVWISAFALAMLYNFVAASTAAIREAVALGEATVSGEM